MQVPDRLKNEIWDYCRANDITDVESFMVRLLERGFSVEKYGETPGEMDPATIETPDKEETPSNSDEQKSQYQQDQNDMLKQQLINSENKVTQLEQQLIELNDKLERLGEEREEDKNENDGGRRDIYGEDNKHIGPATHGSNIMDDE